MLMVGGVVTVVDWALGILIRCGMRNRPMLHRHAYGAFAHDHGCGGAHVDRQPRGEEDQ